MKRIFRRNQIIITTLAIMIAAAGYLNYATKQEIAGAEVYEAGIMEISDEDILAENQALHGVDDGTLMEIASLDGTGEELPVDTITLDGQTADMADSAGAGELTAGAGVGESVVNSAAGTQGTDDNMTGGTDLAGIDNPGEAVLTSGTSVSEYIAGVQLNREQVRATA